MFDFEILEICGMVNQEEHTQRIFPRQIETQNIEKQIPIESRHVSVLMQENRTNVELIKEIMSEEKTTLPCLRNQDWKKGRKRK